MVLSDGAECCMVPSVVWCRVMVPSVVWCRVLYGAECCMVPSVVWCRVLCGRMVSSVIWYLETPTPSALLLILFILIVFFICKAQNNAL